MCDAVVSVLAMSPLNLETYEIAKLSYLPHNIQNVMVEQGLDNHHE